VLDSVSSPITKRVYNMALDEFMGWFQQAPRTGFTKATVSAWRVSLEDRRLGSSSIIIRMSAIRKLAAEAADNGLLAPELAAGISRVKSAKTQGIRVGNWLSLRQAQVLLSAPDITTVRGLRDRADRVTGEGLGEKVVWQLIKPYAEVAGVPGIAPHDLRRTCAKLCRAGGGDLEQIQLLLGHASIQTTERYLGTKQDLVHAANDAIKLRVAV
jgi:site-specific recombinase XerD